MIHTPENFSNDVPHPVDTEEGATFDEETAAMMYRVEGLKSEGREALTAKLKTKAVELLDISKYLIDGQNEGWAKDRQVGQDGETLLKPYSWNVNSGVLLFNDGEKTYVTRSSDELLDELFSPSSGYTKDERIGVPHVNDSGVWKDQYAWNAFAENW